MRTRTLALLASAALLAPSANAAFHLFDIQEVFSNFDGTIQFIELFTNSPFDQKFVNTKTILLEVASPVSTLNTFTFPSNGQTTTVGSHYLIGTSNLTALYGVTPDFILPANFLQVGTGFTNKRLNFAASDIVNLLNLPLDGVGSLNGLPGNDVVTATSLNAQATPRNFAGQTATIPEPVAAGLLGFGLLALLQRRRRN
jgi:serralysin